MGLKTDTLSVGQIVQNYRKMCELLCVEIKNGGKSRPLQIKDWERYFKFSKDKNKYIIEEIYEIPLPKEDNRGKSEGSRNNNNIYGKYVDIILTNYFKSIDESNLPLYTTSNQLAKTVGIINANYPVAFNDKAKFFKYSINDMGKQANRTAMWNVFGIMKASIKSILKSSLDRLSKIELITYEEAYMLVYKRQVRVATSVECTIIIEIEKEVLLEMQITDKNLLQYNDKLRKEYYEKIQELVKQKIECVDTLHVGYKIYIFHDNISEQANISEEINELNRIFMLKTKEKMERNKLQCEEEYSCIGKPNPLWSDYIKDKLNSNYIPYSEYVIKALCSLGYSDIREAIEKQRIVKSDYNKIMDKFSENNLDEEIKALF